MDKTRTLIADWPLFNGKTIRMVHVSGVCGVDELWMMFTDGSAAIIEPEYGEERSIALATSVSLKRDNLESSRLTGMFSEEDIANYERAEEEKKQRHKQYQDEQRRGLYEQLKREFEP